MNREEAIKKLQKQKAEYLDEWVDYSGIAEAFDMAIEALKAQEWIPCSKDLPKENGEYLVTLENGIVKKLGYSTTQRTTYPKGFYYVKDGISWRQTQNPVVAWMPLPEPYKAESEK